MHVVSQWRGGDSHRQRGRKSSSGIGCSFSRGTPDCNPVQLAYIAGYVTATTRYQASPGLNDLRMCAPAARGDNWAENFNSVGIGSGNNMWLFIDDFGQLTLSVRSEHHISKGEAIARIIDEIVTDMSRML